MEGPSDPKRTKTTHAELSGYELFGDDKSCFVNKKPILNKDFLVECDAEQKLYAETALVCYNEKMGTNFAFEKIVDYSTGYRYTHINFMGKYPLKLFFAEISREGDEVVTTCSIVEPGNPLFTLGCGICHPNGLIYHPFFGYLGGHFQYAGCHAVSPYLERLKSDFRNLYKCDSVVKELDGNDLRELKEKTNVFVEKALKGYNKSNYYADFEFLELTGVVRFVEETNLEFGLWLHVNFRATNKNPECSDPATQLFFAEIRMRADHYDVFTDNCYILNVEKPDGETQNGCGVCESIYHPIHRHSAGIQGTILAVWDPSRSRSWIRKYEWRCVDGSMDTNNLRGDLPVGSVAPSLEESGKPFTAKGKQVLEHVGKDTKDLLTLEHGMEVDRNSQDAQHQTDKDQLLKQITFSYFFRERGGFEQSEVIIFVLIYLVRNLQLLMEQIVQFEKLNFNDCQKLSALSYHYYSLFMKKVYKLSFEQESSHAKKPDEVVNFLRLRSEFVGIGLEEQAEIVANATITKLKNLHDDIVSYVVETAASFVDELAGLAPDDIIQKLDFLHSKGVEMISVMCYYAVSRLLMLGRSVVYNAKKAAGKPIICGSEIDEDIMNIDWPVDCIEKAKIIKIRAEEMNGYLEAVCNSFVRAMSTFAEVCVAAAIEGLPQKSIQEKVHQYSEDLWANKKTAVRQILYDLESISYLVNSTSVPIY